MEKQRGQIIIALILIMSVALAIGISVIQKSLVDISTSTKVEESQRAFSAAEAGIEKALGGIGVGSTDPIVLENQSSAQILEDTGFTLPIIASSSNQQEGLEYPSIAKEEFAHVWLADPDSQLNPPATFYKQSSIEIYWGDPNLTSDKAAIEIKIIYYDGRAYKTKAYYFDPDTTRTGGATPNGFTDSSSSANCNNVTPISIPTILGLSRTFYCKQTITSLPTNLMLVRIRLLYNSSSQPVAVRGVGRCGSCSLPPQARIIASRGISGETQRTLQVFHIKKVIPPYFDFAIFSAGEISK